MEASHLQGREILVVDDEVLLRKRLAGFLEKCGAEVTAVGSVAEARNCLADLSFDYALVDIHLPDGEGLDLLRDGAFPETTGVVIMTGEGGVEGAVEAMRLGAGDYLAKPFDHGELPVAFARCRQAGQSARIQEMRSERQTQSEEEFFFGDSLGGVKEQLERVLQADRRLGRGLPPVLIEGATGTGKTTIARWIHRHGPRAGEELVELNCSTLPENLAESELFGHERGAFTDAKKARIGLFEAADGGTLFLDEIPSLSPAIQAKVLTAIEDRKVRRVGGNKDISVDVRLVAATNRRLKDVVRAGEFREDLFHRLDLLRIVIPPLAERGQDIVKLARHLCAGLCRRYRVRPPEIAPAGEARLMAYGWPGNVRELAHELERAIVLGGSGPLDFSQLAMTASPFPDPTGDGAAPAGSNNGGIDPGEWLNPAFVFPPDGFDLEVAVRRLIDRALDQTGNNVSAAARLLGVSRDYVRYRLK